MKFLLIVLAIHLIGELIGNKRKNKPLEVTPGINETVFHPAEFPIRETS